MLDEGGEKIRRYLIEGHSCFHVTNGTVTETVVQGTILSTKRIYPRNEEVM